MSDGAADRNPRSGGAADRNSLGARIRRNRNFYLMTAPFFVLFGLFGAFPMLAAVWIGFTDWDGLNPMRWVGLENYGNILTDPLFGKSVLNTIYIWVGSTLTTCGLAFVLAYLINEYARRGSHLLRMLFLMPLLVAPAVISIITAVLFSSNAGLVNAFLSLFTDEQVTFGWLISTGWIKPIVIFMITWRFLGFHMLIFYAGLRTIPQELYDSARVDGAGGVQIFRRITFPLMLPIIFFSVTSSTVGAFQLFDEPYVLTGGTGGTDNSAQVMGTYLFRTAFAQFDFGTASAMSWVMFALIAVFTVMNSKLLRVRT